MAILLIIIKILLYLLLFLLGLVLLLLIIPVNYRGQVLTAEGFRAQFAFGWAGKLLGVSAEIEGENLDVTLRILGKRVHKLKGRGQEGKKEQSEQKTEKKEKEKKLPRFRELADRTLINEILEYIKRVLNIVKPKYIHLYATYGFDDPSITGMVCGAAEALKPMIPHAGVRLNPDFTQEIIDLDFCAEGSMMAGGLVYQTIRTALKKPVRKILFRKKKS
jgi:hypothetical protein